MSTAALVRQMREALDWCVAEINRDSPSSRNARAALAAADKWLAEQPLTDEQVATLYREYMFYQEGVTPSGVQRIVRAIERVHGIGQQP